MKCKQAVLFEQGQLEEATFAHHAQACASCREVYTLHQALGAALIPSAAPAGLVEQVFAKTTRRPAWFVRWRAVLAGSMAAVLVGIGLYAIHEQSVPFDNAELVAYMNQTGSDEYSTFLSDLEILEQEF